MKEFQELIARIEQEMRRVFEQPKDFVSPVSEAAGEARANIIELHNPIAITEKHTVAISGRVFLLSGEQFVAALKARYKVGRASNISNVVEEFIEQGKSTSLGALSQRFDTNQVLRELRAASTVLATNRAGLVFLHSLDPIEPVSEYVIDGAHSSGKYLPAVELPAVVNADNVELKFESDKGVKISDGRTEKSMVAFLSRIAMVVTGIENNIIEEKAGTPYLGDLVAGLGIICVAIGIAVTMASRMRLWEFGMPVAFAGIILFAVRFGPFFQDYFTAGVKKIVGDAPMKLKFYGELE